MSRPLLANLDPVLRRVRAAGHVFLALDFDGTLSPIAARPEEAVVPSATARLLAELAEHDDVTLCIVSGRALEDLVRRLSLPCIYAGNHGLEIEGPGVSFRHPEAVLRRPVLLSACADLDAALDGIDGAFVERKGLSATVHFRLVAPGGHEQVREAVHRAMQPYAEFLLVLPARKAWEVRPRVEWDKGDALRFAMGTNGASRSLVVCAGDDATDETMFRADLDAISIHVGDDRGTAARYTVPSPLELTEFLSRLRFG